MGRAGTAPVEGESTDLLSPYPYGRGEGNRRDRDRKTDLSTKRESLREGEGIH